LDLYLVVDSGVEDIATQVYQNFRRVFYRQENYLDLHLSLKQGILTRYETPFFSALKAYSQRPTGVFHAMPVSRGNSVFKSHWIQDMARFYGNNIFLAETSATTGGLDSLLQPTGPLKKAQEMAARAFGSQHTFFVTNGTSTANKIVVQALVQPGDIVLIDRDCHKSHHYGLVLSGAYPIYLDSYPVEQYSMYGADTPEFKQELEKNHWVGNFAKSAEMKKRLREEHDEMKALMVELGMAK
jgi:arginine decarboxylase